MCNAANYTFNVWVVGFERYLCNSNYNNVDSISVLKTQGLFGSPTWSGPLAVHYEPPVGHSTCQRRHWQTISGEQHMGPLQTAPTAPAYPRCGSYHWPSKFPAWLWTCVGSRAVPLCYSSTGVICIHIHHMRSQETRRGQKHRLWMWKLNSFHHTMADLEGMLRSGRTTNCHSSTTKPAGFLVKEWPNWLNLSSCKILQIGCEPILSASNRKNMAACERWEWHYNQILNALHTSQHYMLQCYT